MTSMAMSLSNWQYWLVVVGQAVCQKQSGGTYSQELDDPLDPLGEPHGSILAIAGVVTASVVEGCTASMVADCNVLLWVLAAVHISHVLNG